MPDVTAAAALELLRREVGVHDQPIMPGGSPYATVVLPNRWCIGVYYGRIVTYGTLDEPAARWRHEVATDAEVALIRPDGTWLFPHREDGAEAGPMTWLHVPGEVMQRVVDAVAQFREGGTCPCPDCLGWRCGCLDCEADRRATAS
jgi:hypothetical protein